MKLVFFALALSIATVWSTSAVEPASARPRGEPLPAETPPETPGLTPPATNGAPDGDSAPTPEPPPVRIPTDLELRRERAKALVRRGQDLAAIRQTDEALAAFRAALVAYPAYPLAQYELGITLVETKDLVGAEANLRQAIALAPDFGRAHQALGEVLRRQKRFDDAESAYLAAVRYSPKDTVAWYGLAATLKATKNEPEALWALESLLMATENAEAPVAVEARKEAASMIARGVVAKAIEVGPAEEPAVAEPDPSPDETDPSPTDAPVDAVVGTPGPMNRYAGDKAYAERRYLDALSHYRAAWNELVPPPAKPAPAPASDSAPASTPDSAPDTTPDTTPSPSSTPNGDPELAYRIGATFAVMNDDRQAARWWKTALALDPSRELIARHLGILLSRSRVADSTDPIAPMPGAYLMERAKALLLAGDAASALVLVRNREDVGAGHLEAESRLRLGDFQRARAIFEELLATDPEDRIAQAGLGETLLKLGLVEPASKAIEAWMGDNRARPETFIVLRRGEVEARLLAPHEPED